MKARLLFRGYRTTKFTTSEIKGPLEKYRYLVTIGKISQDDHQLAALARLENLHHEIIKYDSSCVSNSNPTTSSLFDFFGGWNSNSQTTQVISKVPPSLYMWGGTGCGKTFLMDMFYDNLPMTRKKRVHFHNFMIDVHKRLFDKKMKSDGGKSKLEASNHAMEQIAIELMAESYIICFDEFQVTDIADAMILKTLFSSMFNQGAIIVATSNRPPNDLYKNGLQRSLFLPFIKLLQDRSIIHSLSESTTDYRLLKHEQIAKNVYWAPVTKENQENFEVQFRSLSSPLWLLTVTSDPTAREVKIPMHDNDVNESKNFRADGGRSTFDKSLSLMVYGHMVYVPRVIHGRRAAMFRFPDLCEQALGPSDYIALPHCGPRVTAVRDTASDKANILCIFSPLPPETRISNISMHLWSTLLVKRSSDLAERFHYLFLADVPQMNLSNRNELRRFITLVDALYEGKVRLVALAACPPVELLKITKEERENSPFDEVFAFDRTVSRLSEMQSESYLDDVAAAHAIGPDFFAKIGVRLASDELLTSAPAGASGCMASRAIIDAPAPTPTPAPAPAPAPADAVVVLSERQLNAIWKQYHLDSDPAAPISIQDFETLLYDLSQTAAAQTGGQTVEPLNLVKSFRKLSATQAAGRGCAAALTAVDEAYFRSVMLSVRVRVVSKQYSK